MRPLHQPPSLSQTQLYPGTLLRGPVWEPPLAEDQIPALFFFFFSQFLCSKVLQGSQDKPIHHTTRGHPAARSPAALTPWPWVQQPRVLGGPWGPCVLGGGCGVPIHADGEGVGPCSALAPGFPCRWRRGTARCGPGTPCRVTPTTCSRPGAGAAPPTAPGAPGAPPSCTPPPRPVSVPCAVSPV